MKCHIRVVPKWKKNLLSHPSASGRSKLRKMMPITPETMRGVWHYLSVKHVWHTCELLFNSKWIIVHEGLSDSRVCLRPVRSYIPHLQVKWWSVFKCYFKRNICSCMFASSSVPPFEESEDYAPPIPESEALSLLVGRMKGIQGHINSCYLDTTLFR